MNQLPLTNGNIIRHRELSIGYIKQNDYDLSKYENCFEYLRNKYPNKLDKELRTALGSFLFKKDEVFKQNEFNFVSELQPKSSNFLDFD